MPAKASHFSQAPHDVASSPSSDLIQSHSGPFSPLSSHGGLLAVTHWRAMLHPGLDHSSPGIHQAPPSLPSDHLPREFFPSDTIVTKNVTFPLMLPFFKALNHLTYDIFIYLLV